MDSRQNAVEQIATDRDLSELEGTGAGMSNDPRTNLY